MFPHRKSLYEGHQEPGQERKESVIDLADPRHRDETIRRSGFSEKVFIDDAIERIQRGNSKNVGIYGLSHVNDLKVEDFATKGNYTQTRTLEDGSRVKNLGSARFSISSGDKGTTITVIPERNPEYQRLLKMFREKDGELPEEAKRLIDSAKKYDRGGHNSMFSVFEPEQIDTLRALSFMYGDLTENNIFAAKYFAHLIALNAHGTFADTSSMNHGTILTKLADKPLIVNAYGRPPRIHASDNPDREPLIGEAKENLEAMLNNPEKNIFLQNPNDVEPGSFHESGTEILDSRRIIRAFDGLGRAFNYSSHSEPGSAISAMAAEAYVTVIADALTTKKNNDTFVDRLKRINSLERFNGLLDTFLSVYTQKGKTTPGNVRGKSIHNGGDHFFTPEGERTDIWASLFYIDLAKTLTSALAGSPNVYSDFDKYARNFGLVDSRGHNVAYVPLNVAGHDTRRND